MLKRFDELSQLCSESITLRTQMYPYFGGKLLKVTGNVLELARNRENSNYEFTWSCFLNCVINALSRLPVRKFLAEVVKLLLTIRS